MALLAFCTVPMLAQQQFPAAVADEGDRGNILPHIPWSYRTLRLPTFSVPAALPAAGRIAVTAAPTGTTADIHGGRINDVATPESDVAAAVNPTDSNNLVVMTSGEGGPNIEVLCPIYFSRDFGVTWRKSAFQSVPRGTRNVITHGGLPTITFDADGKAYAAWLDSYYRVSNRTDYYYGIFYATSTDGGETWNRPDHDTIAHGTVTPSLHRSDMFSEPTLAVDRSSTPTRNTVYASMVYQHDTLPLRILVRRLSPGTDRFSESLVPVDDNGPLQLTGFPDINVDADARVHVVFFGTPDYRAGYSIWHTSSIDGGRTFAPPTQVADAHVPSFSRDALTDTIVGIPRVSMYPCVKIAIDKSEGPSRGFLYLTWTADGTASRLENGLDIYFARSTDHGATWSQPTVVNRDPRLLWRSQFFSSIDVNRNGVIAISWYDRRDDPDDIFTHYFTAFSFDGGVTFTKGARVTSEPADFAHIGDRTAGYGIGSRTQVVATDGYAIPIWSDGRTNDGNISIYAARMPLTVAASGMEGEVANCGSMMLHQPVVAGDDAAIGFYLGTAATARIAVYDANGRAVGRPVEETFEAGDHVVHVDLAACPSGFYCARLTASSGSVSRPFVLAR